MASQGYKKSCAVCFQSVLHRVEIFMDNGYGVGQASPASKNGTQNSYCFCCTGGSELAEAMRRSVRFYPYQGCTPQHTEGEELK